MLDGRGDSSITLGIADPGKQGGNGLGMSGERWSARPRVLDPTIDSAGGKRLHEVRGRNDPHSV